MGWNDTKDTMRANPYPDYDDDLKFSVWDKKKGSLPPGDLADDLKALQKKHDAVDWKQFDADWPKASKIPAELDDAFAKRDRIYRGSAFPLKRDALAIAKLAKALEKGAAKPVLEAAKAIGKAANAYADAVDAGIDELKSVYDQAKAALSKDAADKDEEDDEPGNVLLDPKRLLATLQRCKRDPEVSMNFGFVDAKDKQPAVFAMHPRMSGKKLYEALKTETGVKTGAFGTAWVQVDGEFKGTCLMLQLDKPLSGLVKKVKGPVKAAGFKIAKAVLWSADGKVFEQEDETDEPAAPGAGAAGAAAPGAGGAGTGATSATSQTTEESRKPASAEQLAYTQRLFKVRDRYDQALRAQHPESSKLRAVMGLASEKADEKKDYAAAIQALQMVEKLLGSAAEGAASGTAANPASKAPGTVDAGDAFKARLTAMLPSLKAAQAAGGDRAQDIKLKVSEAGVSARKKEFAQANALLDEVDEMLQASGAAAAGGTGSQEEKTDPKESESAELYARLQPDYETVERGPLSPALKEQFQPIRTAWMMAVEAIEKGQFDRASLILKRVDSAGGLARLRQAITDEAKQPRARSAAGGGAVALAKMRLKWNAAREARQTAIDSMKTVASELLETEEYEDDPRTDAAAAKIRNLSAQVPALDEKLSGLLEDLADAADQGMRDRLRTQIRASIQAYKGKLDDVPLLMALQNTPLGFTPIGETIYNALNALDAALA